MKKNILLLLVSALLPLLSVQAATDITKCYGNKLTMEASTTGNSYQWYKDGTIITGATKKTYTVNSVEASAKYECKISTSGTTFDTGNLITEGSFAKSCSNTVNYGKVTNSQNNNVQYELMNLQCSVNDYTSPGFTTIVKNSTDAKPTFFEPLASASNKGEFFLVCDGSSSSGVRIWQARDISLKAGVTYQFSCMVANVDKNTTTNGSNSLSNLEFRIEYDGNYGDGDLLMAFKAPATPGKWEQQSTTFTPTKDLNYCHIHIRNHNVLSAGNDFALDDIYFGTEITTAGSSTTETFNLTVYDTFDYKFKTEAVCPGAEATITTTLVPAHNGTLEPESNYKYEWKENGKTPVVSTNKNLVVTAPNTVGTVSYVLSTSSSICYNSGAKSETTSIKVEDNNCGTNTTATIDYDPCLGADITLTAQATGTYSWSTGETTQSINISSAEDKTITCTVTNTVGGIKHTVTESHVIKTKNCNTSDEQTEQVEKGGSITLVVPESKRCKDEDGNCEYIWYKKVNGELIIVDRNPIDIYPYAHTIDNADESEYICEIIKPSTGQKHTETYKIEILDAETVCYDASSTAEQTKTITGYEGENHAWYWAQGEDKVEFPEGYVTTDGNTITLDLSKFSNGSQPTDVKIIHEYDKEKEVIEEDPTNPMRFKITFEEVLSKSQFDGNKTITFDEYTKLVISENYRYTNTFNNKYETDIVHEGVLRITDNGLNSTVATGDDNTYFMDIDAGSKTGELFTIYSTGNFKKGEKYMFTFLLKNTTSDATKYPANIGCSLKTNTGEEIVLKEAREIEQTIWQTYIKIFEIEQDAESLEITFTSNNDSPTYNDFALDNIELTTDIPEYLRNAQPRATTVDTWKEEITLTINPITHQDIVETSNPDKEFKTEVKLDYNNKNEYVTFFYDPAVSYIEGSDKYVDYKEATNFYGCPHLVSFTLNLFSLEPDKFFTPNGDGVHDKWMVKGIETAPSAHIMIYDRHSKLLYKCLGSEFQGWDGTFEGHHMVQDDYWYVILIPETNETLSGHFTLKR